MNRQFPKEIYIIGFGVVAKSLAVALAFSGRKVTILRGQTDEEKRRSEVIEAELELRALRAEITIDSIGNYDQLDGIIVLANKTFGNTEIADKLSHRHKRSPIVFFQNGLGIENSFLKIGFTELHRCVVLAASQAVTSNKVRFRVVASSPIGLINGSSLMLEEIVEHLHSDFFPFHHEPDIQPLIWKKLISNCVFNSICPLLEIDNGVFYRNGDALELAKTVISECINVAAENGIVLTKDEMVEQVVALSRRSDGQRISTYQDILNNKRTEIESMNLGIAKIAIQSSHCQVPITRLLGELIKIKSGF